MEATTRSLARVGELHADPNPDLSTDAARRDALASSLAILIGTFDLAELERMDAEAKSILNDRHTWARHADATKWCSVLEYARGSVITRCHGRWSVKDDYETESRPAGADRCQACQRALELDNMRRAVETGLSELRDAEPVIAQTKHNHRGFDFGGEGG